MQKKHRACCVLQSNHLEEDERNKNATINIVSHKKGWNSVMTQAHMEPPHIPLVKGIYDGKPDKDFVNMKLRRDPTSSTKDPYDKGFTEI